MTDPPEGSRRQIAGGGTRTRCMENDRPVLLTFITLGGLAGPLWWPVVQILQVAAEGPRWDPAWELYGKFALYAALWMAGLPLFVGLHFGRYWAWIVFQGLCAGGILLMAGLVGFGRPRLEAPSIRIPSLLWLLLWLYLRSEKVKRFCSVGRPIRFPGLPSGDER